MLLVQEYLKTHSLEELNKDFGINARIDKNLVSLNYDQIDSKPGVLISDQCRGIILSKADYSEINTNEIFGKSLLIARPLERFYNYGDVNAKSINFSDPNLTYFEKLDGTLLILYWNPWDDKWETATRSVARADLSIDGFKEHTFRTLFEKSLYETLKSTNWFLDFYVHDENPKDIFNDYTSQLDKHSTYCFELTTPLNRVVVDYKEFRVHVLAIIDTHSGKESWPGYPVPKELFGVPWCPSYQINGIKELIEFVNSKSPTEHEGVVVRDRHGNRIKLKNASYAAYNRAKDLAAKSPRALMELILLEKIDDVIPMLIPELQQKTFKLQENLRKLISRIDTDYKEIKQELGENFTRKDFALKVQERKGWIDPIMNIYAGKYVNAKDYIMKQQLPEKTWANSFIDTLIEKCNKQ